MKIGLINKFFPPYNSATGYHALQLAQFLKEKNHDISLFGCHTEMACPKEERVYKRHLLKLSYNGKQKTLRLIFNLFDSLRLVLNAKKSKQDFYIVLSDPPFLQFWSTILLPSKKSIFWFMDIFPDAFVANNLISRTNIFNRIIQKKLTHFQPLGIITLGKQQANYLFKYYQNVPKVNLPIGLVDNKVKNFRASIPHWYSDHDKIYFCYAGNLGEAHDMKFLKRVITCLDYTKHLFILSCTGSKAKELISWASEFKELIRIVDHIPFENYKYIDVHLVSLLNQWTHICVPSKAITALQHKGAILFNGSPESDTWKYIENSAWLIGPNENNDKKIQVLIESIDKKTVLIKKEHSVSALNSLKNQLLKGYDEINYLFRS